jgi:hypothetical protein
LTQQLLDGDLREYLMEKEQWNEGTFDNICWKIQKVALKRMSKARQMAIAKLVHNLAFTGARHTQWYGGTKECCLCNSQYEDWRHMMPCQSIDAELLRADSWRKLKKAMDKWKIPNDVWTDIQKGMQHYMKHPAKRDPHDMPQEPPTPFMSFI